MKYHDLLGHLRTQITAGAWPDGHTIPPQRKLAKQYKVGERAVRLALDGLFAEGLIAPTGKRRWIARRPKGFGLKATSPVLLVMGMHLLGQLQSPDGDALLRGLLWGVAELEYPITILHDWHYRNVFPSAHQIGVQPLKGVLLWGQLKPAVLRRYAKLTVPVILVDRPGEKYKLSSVAFDNVRAAEEATRRLIELGHRRIAFVRFVALSLREIDDDSRERQDGFLLACRNAGLPQAREWIFNCFSRDTIQSVWLRNLLAARPRYTAAVVVDENHARVVRQGVEAAGLQVPKDFSLVTFQGTAKNRPEFTGPGTDFFELGRQAARLLDAPPGKIANIRMPYLWKDARSCAPA